LSVLLHIPFDPEQERRQSYNFLFKASAALLAASFTAAFASPVAF
jgi:hypothetical protein